MDRGDPKISVIIPVYQVETYLDACIRSVTGQTYTNLEILLADDGSPDGCGAICDRWAEADPRIRVLHLAHGGLSAARNAALAAASGELIAFADSDDLMRPDMIAALYRLLTENRADMAICDLSMIDAEGRPLKNGRDFFTQEEIAVAPYSLLERYDRIRGLNYVHPKLYRRNVLAGIAFPEGRMFEDMAVMHRILYGCSRVAVTPRKLYEYRVRPGSIVSSGVSVRHLDKVEALYGRVLFYEEKGLADLLPEASRSVLAAYQDLVNQGLTVRTEAEKARLREIRAMVWACYVRHVRRRLPVQGFLMAVLPRSCGMLRALRSGFRKGKAGSRRP